jgi:hypothetical protein
MGNIFSWNKEKESTESQVQTKQVQIPLNSPNRATAGAAESETSKKRFSSGSEEVGAADVFPQTKRVKPNHHPASALIRAVTWSPGPTPFTNFETRATQSCRTESNPETQKTASWWCKLLVHTDGREIIVSHSAVFPYPPYTLVPPSPDRPPAAQLSAANETFVLGREAGGLDLPPDDLRVSRRHCTLRRPPATATAAATASASALLVDHSLNGTFVNGERVPQGPAGRALRSGDRIALVRGVRIAVDACGSPAVRRDEDAPEQEEHVFTYLEPSCHGADTPDAAATDAGGHAAARRGAAAAADGGPGGGAVAEAAGAAGGAAARAESLPDSGCEAPDTP